MKRLEKYYYVYITASINKVIYVGYTDCLIKRINQHKKGIYQNSFSKKYKTNRLVYWEQLFIQKEALIREKQLKGWSRDKKVKLIEDNNLGWNDLYNETLEIFKVGSII